MKTITSYEPFLALKPRRRAHGSGSPKWTFVLNLGLGVAYAASGYAGLKLAFIGGAVTLFWPPSGIAFAAVWLGGLRLMPGVGLGALAVNLLALQQPGFAAAVAFGDMLPCLVGVAGLRAMLARRPLEGELGRVLWFILVAVLGSTTLSASVGTLALTLSGKGDGAIPSTWLVWWMGDAMGVLIVAPPILLWRRMLAARLTFAALRDAAAFAVAGLGIVAGLLLIRNPIWAVELCKLATLLLSLWAGARFGLNGPAAMTLLMAAGAIGVTLDGVGPFKRENFYDSFTLVHSYLFAEAVAGMLLAAALSDLRRSLLAETAARGEAEAASAARIRLLTMISHDVRTPLGGMMGVLQTLQASSSSEELRRLAELGLRAGRTLTTLVTNILDVARVDAGRILLEQEGFDLHQSLRDLVELAAPAAAAKGLRLELHAAGPPPPRLWGDRARVEQLFGNLINNAISYTSWGAVTVGLAYSRGAPWPVCVEIRDTGPGIDATRVAQMFDAFVLAPRSGARSAGLGLGLHISRGLAELMDGEIAYAPARGGGSLFTVRLPLAPDPGPAAASPMAETDAPQHILLVEDDDVAREVTCVLLERRGHWVVTAADGAAAVDAATDHPFDLVLMDIHLGDARNSGLEVARHIRALPTTGRSLSIVALTGDGSDDFRHGCRLAGLDGLMVKPFLLEDGLARAVAQARWTDGVGAVNLGA